MADEQAIEQLRASTIKHIDGPTILLGSGTYFDYLAPEKSEMTIEDVAYGLAFEGRFANQCVLPNGRRVFYGVGEHSLRMCLEIQKAVPERPDLALDGLMHEIEEGPWGDLTGPAKSLCPDYKRLSKATAASLLPKFGVRMSDPLFIKRWDCIMLSTEKRDLTNMAARGDTWSWTQGQEPLPAVIVPMPVEQVAEAFIRKFHELKGALDG